MKKVNKVLMNVIHILERIIAVILMIVVAVAAVYLTIDIITGLREGFDEKLIKTVLEDSFNIIIVLEFIRVLVKHSMGMVVEVLIFALARRLIVTEQAAIEVALTVVVIAVLLACRKFLFVPDDLKKVENKNHDKQEESKSQEDETEK